MRQHPGLSATSPLQSHADLQVDPPCTDIRNSSHPATWDSTADMNNSRARGSPCQATPTVTARSAPTTSRHRPGNQPNHPRSPSSSSAETDPRNDASPDPPHHRAGRTRPPGHLARTRPPSVTPGGCPRACRARVRCARSVGPDASCRTPVRSCP